MAATPNQAALSMFCANQETWVDFVPLFTLDEEVGLLDGNHMGPWEAGWPTRVPLWIARYLQNKSMGRISPNGDGNDNWMKVEPLKQILEFEKTHETLWTNTSNNNSGKAKKLMDHENDDSLVEGDGEHDDGADKPYLPERYWELSQCYSTADNPAAVALLLQDIWQVRLDKLRRQFQQLYKQKERLTAVNVPGIGTAELAVMKDVISKALTEKAKLQREATLPSSNGKAVGTTGSAQQSNSSNSNNVVTPAEGRRPLRHRAALRRFRKDGRSGNAALVE